MHPKFNFIRLEAIGESSEEERSAIELHHNEYNSDTQNGYNRATQNPTMGPLRASDFKEKYTLYKSVFWKLY